MPRTSNDRVSSSLEVSDADSAASRIDGEFETDSISALFGSLGRGGQWLVPDYLTVSAYFGEVKLDLREASLPASGIVEIDATAVFGSIKLIVPAGTEVEMEGAWAAFGEIGHKKGWFRLRSFLRRFVTGEEEEPHPDHEPFLLRVTGRAIFGEVIASTG